MLCKNKRIAYGRKINKPVWVGEFGAVSKAVNYLQYDRDLINILNDLHLPWTYWHYKNLKGLSDTQAIYFANSSNKFFQLISEVRKSTELFSALDEQKLQQALESLSTAYFQEKTNLKKLLRDIFNIKITK